MSIYIDIALIKSLLCTCDSISSSLECIKIIRLSSKIQISSDFKLIIDSIIADNTQQINELKECLKSFDEVGRITSSKRNITSLSRNTRLSARPSIDRSANDVSIRSDLH